MKAGVATGGSAEAGTGDDAAHGVASEARRRAQARLHASSIEGLRQEIAPPLARAKGRMVALELGCGHGHFLTGYAESRPDWFFLGVDFCRERIARANRKASRSTCDNLFFLHAEGQQLLQAWPEERKLVQVLLLFPDPWPKRRHRKNRLFSRPLLDRLAQLGEPDARLCFRTDSEDYFSEASRLVADHAAWQLADERWPFESTTVFQQKATRFASLVAVKR